jgi:hypothetical protein
MAKRKSIKGVHELEIEFTRLTEQVKAWKVIAISCSSVILACATAFFGLTQYNLHVKVNAAIEQAASKKAEKLANEYAEQAKASAEQAKTKVGTIDDLLKEYQPQLEKRLEEWNRIDPLNTLFKQKNCKGIKIDSCKDKKWLKCPEGYYISAIYNAGGSNSCTRYIQCCPGIAP